MSGTSDGTSAFGDASTPPRVESAAVAPPLSAEFAAWAAAQLRGFAAELARSAGGSGAELDGAGVSAAATAVSTTAPPSSSAPPSSTSSRRGAPATNASDATAVLAAVHSAALELDASLPPKSAAHVLHAVELLRAQTAAALGRPCA
jgi:hypothetical protein